MSRQRPGGVLIDLDGTLYQDDVAVPGAAEAVRRLRTAGVPVRFGTNTTRMPRAELLRRLAGLGIDAHRDELFTAPVAAAGWLRGRGITRANLCIAAATVEDFDGVVPDSEAPEAIVVGDLGPEWSFERLNRAFRALLDGAVLVALQRNRYWRTDGALTLDGGPFVAALEYAADVSAVLVGKPAAAFFETAAGSMGIDVEAMVVVGDDASTDVAGARAAGATGVQVRTGKFRPSDLEGTPAPEHVIESVAELPALLGVRA